jgi:hypothetical protein
MFPVRDRPVAAASAFSGMVSGTSTESGWPGQVCHPKFAPGDGVYPLRTRSEALQPQLPCISARWSFFSELLLDTRTESTGSAATHTQTAEQKNRAKRVTTM